MAETNDIPGIEVLKLLDQLNIIYTGADEYFYDITTSKITMKELFDSNGVPTPAWQVINDLNMKDVFKKLRAR